MNLAISTIAMSTYNMLALAPEPITIGKLYAATCNGHGFQIERPRFLQAIHSLLNRAFLQIHNYNGHPITGSPHSQNDKFSVYDRHRRLVKWRDRDGNGWDGWKLDGGSSGPIPLELVVKFETDAGKGILL